MQDWVVENQYVLFVLSAFLGTAITIFLFFVRNQPITWRIVDLFWIMAGGGAAITAFVLSVILSDAGTARRAVDLYTSRVATVQNEAKRFGLLYCDDVDVWRSMDIYEQMRVACNNVRDVENLTRIDAKLVRFSKLVARGDTLFAGTTDRTYWYLTGGPFYEFGLKYRESGPGTAYLVARDFR